MGFPGWEGHGAKKVGIGGVAKGCERGRGGEREGWRNGLFTVDKDGVIRLDWDKVVNANVNVQVSLMELELVNTVKLWVKCEMKLSEG